MSGYRGARICVVVTLLAALSACQGPSPHGAEPSRLRLAAYWLPAGPGGVATQDVPQALQLLGAANEQRDLVFVDQRGTGGSSQLSCPKGNDPTRWAAQLRACLAGLGGDTRAYTTAWAMDDLDEVRAALGYRSINLYGGNRVPHPQLPAAGSPAAREDYSGARARGRAPVDHPTGSLAIRSTGGTRSTISSKPIALPGVQSPTDGTAPWMHRRLDDGLMTIGW
jgi:hypothetical protein